MIQPAYVIPSLTRNPRRTGAYLVGTVIAAALLSSVLFFVVGSAQILTQRSIAGVRPDMQVVLTQPGTGAGALRREVAQVPGIARAERFALAGFTSTQMSDGNRLGQAGAGELVAVDPSYFSTFGAPALRQGAMNTHGIAISQDLGTNLGARVGSFVTLHFAGNVPPQRLRVTGVASMLNTDTLFAPLDPLRRANPFNPPANVALIDYGLFERHLKPLLLRTGLSPSTGPVVRTQAPVSEQVHLRLDRARIPSDPAQARAYSTELRHRLELSLTGRATVLDNVAAALDTAQTDVLWAQVIFVFLALPGVILAATLARYVTASVIDSQRRELALLRIRGIGPRRLLSLLAVALVLVALLGVVLGLGAGWLTIIFTGGATLPVGPLLVRTLLLALGAGLLLGAVVTFWPLARFIRAPIVEARREVERGGTPLWSRLYLDWFMLAAGILVYLVTQRNGFQPVLNAEGNPTISLSFFTFLAPMLFWLGSILVLVRVSRRLVTHSGRLLAPRGGHGQGIIRALVAGTLARRAGSLHQAVLLVAMAVAFSTALTTFVHTYNQQQRVDAELSLGSDVKVTVPDRRQSGTVAARLNVPGAAAVTPFRTTVAYVGSEIQDIFGLDVPTFTRATRLTDSFFVGSTAAQTMQLLRTTPNGIVVSAETARDYSLNRGDSLRLRMYDSAGRRFVPVLFRLVGVAREFATAPKDAFLVANLAYIQQATHDRGVDTFLIKTNGTPASVAGDLRRRFAAGPLVHVQDIGSAQQQLATSLTSLDLTALSHIDFLYTLIIVATALLVFALAVLLERSRDFALLEVLGTTVGQIGVLVLVELSYAVIVGSILGLAVGLGFAQMLIQILTSIFDPPPDSLALPWSALGVTFGVVAAAGLAAWLVALGRLAHSNLAAALRQD